MRPSAPVFLLLLGLLTGCGGGGDGGGNSPPPRPSASTLSGTAAANTALAGYAVEVSMPEGTTTTRIHAVAAVTAGADGRYSALLGPGDAPPFVVKASQAQQEAEPQYQRLYSITNHGATAQVTSLTSLLVARLLNRKPAYIGIDLPAVRALQDRSDAVLNAAREQVVAYLLTRPNKDNGNLTAPVDVSAVTDFVAMPLTVAPGDPYFEALRRLHASLMDSETIDGVEEHMLFRNDPPADLRAILALDFLADCTVEGIDDGTLPRGRTRIVFDSIGITFGAVDFPFQTGDLLHVQSGQTVVDSWQFESTARRTRVDLVLPSDFNPLSVSLSRPIGVSESRCNALGEVPLTGKHPSLIALIRLLGQSLPSRDFQCAAPVTTGFQAGINLLVLEQNGALRINGPGGPSLHLPSMNISVNARLVIAMGEVAPIRPNNFGATRIFRGGSDAFSVNLADDGRIAGLSFGRQNPQSSLSQRCGAI